MPEQMAGKTIITNTVTKEDRALLKRLVYICLITTTPNFNGRSFGTNVLEAALVALAGKSGRLDAAGKLLKKHDIRAGNRIFYCKGVSLMEKFAFVLHPLVVDDFARKFPMRYRIPGLKVR